MQRKNDLEFVCGRTWFLLIHEKHSVVSNNEAIWLISFPKDLPNLMFNQVTITLSTFNPFRQRRDNHLEKAFRLKSFFSLTINYQLSYSLESPHQIVSLRICNFVRPKWSWRCECPLFSFHPVVLAY